MGIFGKWNDRIIKRIDKFIYCVNKCRSLYICDDKFYHNDEIGCWRETEEIIVISNLCGIKKNIILDTIQSRILLLVFKLRVFVWSETIKCIVMTNLFIRTFVMINLS